MLKEVTFDDFPLEGWDAEPLQRLDIEGCPDENYVFRRFWNRIPGPDPKGWDDHKQVFIQHWTGHQLWIFLHFDPVHTHVEEVVSGKTPVEAVKAYLAQYEKHLADTEFPEHVTKGIELMKSLIKELENV